MKKFGTEIYAAVKSGTLTQPFNAAMAKIACPGWANATYNTFFGKHSIGNGHTSELFVRSGRGFYQLKNST